MTLREFIKSLIESPEYQQSITSRANEGRLPLEIELMLLEIYGMAEGRPPLSADTAGANLTGPCRMLALVPSAPIVVSTVEEHVREQVRQGLTNVAKERGLGPEVLEVLTSRMDAVPFTTPDAYYTAMEDNIKATLTPLVNALCESIHKGDE